MTIKRLLGSLPSQISRNRDLGTVAFQDAQSVNISGILAPKTVTFANLPAASASNTGQMYQVSDVGANGSLWKSNGTLWAPTNNTVSLLTGSLAFLIAPTGSIAVTTGVVTFGTSVLTYLISNSPIRAYVYYPANAWTSSTAGWYYTVFSSGTQATVYSNQYTTGQPTVPASPTLVTTGAGAYTGVIGTVLGPNVNTPANTIAVGNLVKLWAVIGANNSAGTKTVGFANSGTSYLQSLVSLTTTVTSSTNYVLTLAADNSATAWSISSGYANGINFKITTAVTNGFYLSTAVATDWVSLPVYDIVLESQ